MCSSFLTVDAVGDTNSRNTGKYFFFTLFYGHSWAVYGASQFTSTFIRRKMWKGGFIWIYYIEVFRLFCQFGQYMPMCHKPFKVRSSLLLYCILVWYMGSALLTGHVNKTNELENIMLNGAVVEFSNIVNISEIILVSLSLVIEL